MTQKADIIYVAEKIVKKVCESFREHSKIIIDFERKNATVEKKELNSYKDVKVCHEKKIQISRL